MDNELQDLIPSLLKATLAFAWSERWDWFFGVNMGIYYDPQKPAIVPDGFLSLGVKRYIDGDLRFSYVLWEEEKPPVLALEVIPQVSDDEYSTKKESYAQELGVLYYVIYKPLRRKKPPLEVYQLVDGQYFQLPGNPIWLPEIGLGIGRERGIYQGIAREWLYWYDEQGQRFLTPEERIQQIEEQLNLERQLRIITEQQVIILTERLKALGVEPESLA